MAKQSKQTKNKHKSTLKQVLALRQSGQLSEEFYKQNNIQKSFRELEQSGVIEGQKTALKDFINYNLANNLLKPLTLYTQSNLLIQFGKDMKKEFNAITNKEYIDYIAYLVKLGRKPSTISTRIAIINKFFRWLYQNENPDVVKGIIPQNVPTNVDKSNLFTKEDILSMVSVADNQRDKTIVMALWDTAARAHELLGAKIKNLEIDTYGMRVRVDGKTGKRPIRFRDSLPYIQQWLNLHKDKNNPEAYLFYPDTPTKTTSRLSYNAVYGRMRELGRKAGINKRVRLHLFRHTRLDYLACREGFNEKDLRLFAGWSKNSDMPNTYLHYDHEGLDDKILAKDGKVKVEEKDNSILKPLTCSRCGVECQMDTIFCSCGQIVNSKKFMEMETLKERETNATIQFFMKMAEDKELMQRFKEFSQTRGK